jgi:hypothetical protein
MIHVTASDNARLYQLGNDYGWGPSIPGASVDVYLVSGSVELIYGNHGGQLRSALDTTVGQWETLTLGPGTAPAILAILAPSGGGEFYADNAAIPELGTIWAGAVFIPVLLSLRRKRA